MSSARARRRLGAEGGRGSGALASERVDCHESQPTPTLSEAAASTRSLGVNGHRVRLDARSRVSCRRRRRRRRHSRRCRRRRRRRHRRDVRANNNHLPPLGAFSSLGSRFRRRRRAGCSRLLFCVCSFYRSLARARRSFGCVWALSNFFARRLPRASILVEALRVKRRVKIFILCIVFEEQTWRRSLLRLDHKSPTTRAKNDAPLVRDASRRARARASHAYARNRGTKSAMGER